LLATENSVHATKDHLWHVETLARICRADDELLLATPFQVVDLTDKSDQEKGIKWWEQLTAAGGENSQTPAFKTECFTNSHTPALYLWTSTHSSQLGG
jgi:hypothetical protein